MDVVQAIEARERIEARMRRREQRAPLDDYFEGDPYHCPGPGGAHHPTQGNPMATGRCLACRAFIGSRLRSNEWRTITIAQASRWGMLGRRRT